MRREECLHYLLYRRVLLFHDAYILLARLPPIYNITASRGLDSALSRVCYDKRMHEPFGFGLADAAPGYASD